jgi:hypothetical protein
MKIKGFIVVARKEALLIINTLAEVGEFGKVGDIAQTGHSSSINTFAIYYTFRSFAQTD